MPGVCTSCMLLLYALGIIGGPELKPRMQRSASGRSSTLSYWASAAVGSASAPSAVSAGTRPIGGSTTSDVCFATRVPKSHQKSL